MSELPLPQSSTITAFTIPDVCGFTQTWDNMRYLGKCHHYAQGSRIDDGGESCFDFFFIERGEVSIMYDTHDGRSYSVITFTAGSIANLASSMLRVSLSSYFQCITDSTILRFPGKLLHDPHFVAKYPEFVIHVMKIFGTVIFTHHTSLTDMLRDDFILRFCRFLLALSTKHNSLDFAPNITHENMAVKLNIHRATLERAIKQLKDDKIIQCFTSRRVVILNMEKLRMLAIT